MARTVCCTDPAVYWKAKARWPPKPGTRRQVILAPPTKKICVQFAAWCRVGLLSEPYLVMLSHTTEELRPRRVMNTRSGASCQVPPGTISGVLLNAIELILANVTYGAQKYEPSVSTHAPEQLCAPEHSSTFAHTLPERL